MLGKTNAGGSGKNYGAYLWKKYNTQPYKQLDYIQSDGTQYIDTGLINKTGFKFETKINFSSLGSTPYSDLCYFCGSYDDSSQVRSYALLYQKKIGIGVSTDTFAETVSTNTDYVLEASTISGNGYLKINGVQKATNTATYDLSSSNLKFRIFGADTTSGSYENALAKAKLYYFKIYDAEGNLLRDYVPCMNNSGEVGLLDKVNNKFYANNGTGTFTYGSEVGTVGSEPTTFADFVVSDDPTAYPDGEEKDGYCYKKSSGGADTYSGDITTTSAVDSIQIANPFGKAEKVKCAALIQTSNGTGMGATILVKFVEDDIYWAYGASFGIKNNSHYAIDINDNNITFRTIETSNSYKFYANQTYKWEVIGNE